ncbi:MAG TPA: VCBS repeat-containing protein [Steroidobacteraceae bacterium]
MNSKLQSRALALTAGAGLLASLAGCGHDDDYFVVGGPLPPGYASVYVPNSVAVADVNGDGMPDLLVATTVDQGGGNNPGIAAVYLGNHASPGSYQPGMTYPTTGTDPSGIAVLNLSTTNGAGTDMVVSNFGSGTATVFLHDPANAGKYLAGSTLTIGGQPNQVISADINGDGAPDLVFADLSTSGSAVVVLQDVTHPGQFLAPTSLATGGMTPSVAAADLNGDGLVDVVAADFDSNGNNGQVTIFFQSPASPASFQPAVNFPAGAQPQAVRIADVNGDGLPDLVVANRGPGRDGTGAPGVSVLLQDAAHPGSFLAPVTYATPWGAIDVAVGDLNGDGKPDLAVASLGPGPTGAVSVLLQAVATPGTFGAANSYPGFGQPLSIAIADLNGDGHPDIALADGNNATVMLQSASSPGTFAQAMPVN